MYKELDQFKKKVAGINESITKLEDKKAKQMAQKNKAEAERQDLLLSEALTGKEPEEKQLEKLRREIVVCEEEIAEIDERIKLIEEKRAESLKPFIPDIKKGYSREIDKLNREADAQFEDARKILCEYMLALQKVGRSREKANEIHNDFVLHAKMADFEQFSLNHWNRGAAIPMYELFNDYSGIQIGIREGDQKAALNGSVPPFVLYYQLTGEVESNPNIIRQKLNEVKK